VNAQNRPDLAPERPLPNSYWVIPGRLLAGEHPLGRDEAKSRARLERLSSAGVDLYVDLTEEGEQPEYRHLLPEQSEYVHFPILDCAVPENASQTRAVLATLRKALADNRVAYVHCRAGIGRTGLIIGCLLAEDERNGRAGLKRLNRLWRQCARAETWPKVPQTAEQADYIRSWPKLKDTGFLPDEAIDVPGLIAAPEGSLALARLDPAGAPPLLLSVIVPTFNEALNIEQLLGRLTRLLDDSVGERYEIVVVDDDSPDRTWERALSLVQQHPCVRVMRRRKEKGLATAVIRGWQAARGEVLCVIDADMQHPPEIVLALYGVIARGADMAVASRHLEGGGVSDWSFARRIVSRAAQLIGLLALPGVVGRISDPMSGYFMIRRTAIEGVELHPLGYKILIEVLARGRFAWIGEVPYVFKEREHGGSKATARVYLEYVRHLLRLRFATLPIARFLRFAAVGLSGAVVDMTLLYVLSDPGMLGWGLTRSKLIAAEVAILNNFAWNDAWTFRDLAAGQRGLRQRLRRLCKYQAVCLVGVVLNTVLLNVLFNLLGMNRYVANAIAIAAVTGWNFWLNLKLSWRTVEPSA